MLQFSVRVLRGFYDAICLALMGRSALLVAPSHHLAARAVKEKYGVPLVITHTEPVWSWEESMGKTHAGWDDWLLTASLGPGWGEFPHKGCSAAAVAPALQKFCDEIGMKIPRERL